MAWHMTPMFHIKTNWTSKLDRVNDSTIGDENKIKLYTDYLLSSVKFSLIVHFKIPAVIY